MKIAVIGAGKIGGNLTRRLSGLGHDVTVANSRGPDTLADLAAETGARPATVADAPAGAEVVIVTIPTVHVAQLPDGLLDTAAPGVVVVDTNNYYPGRDGRIEPIVQGATESRWVSDQLGHPVVKAFNTLYSDHLLTRARPAGAPDRIALPVAGDDEADKAVVCALIDALGFDPVDAGTIDESWRQQPGSPVYGADLDAADTRRALAEATPERLAEFTP